jgi:hypothetical protein
MSNKDIFLIEENRFSTCPLGDSHVHLCHFFLLIIIIITQGNYSLQIHQIDEDEEELQ